MLKGFGWTNERIEQLRDLHGRGSSLTDIASRMGCSRGSVSGKLHRLGLMIRQVEPRRKPKPPSNPRPSPPSANHPWKRQAAAEATGPCHDDTRMYDLAPESGGVLWLKNTMGCRYPMNAAVPIHAHRACGRPRAKSGLPGDPYCTVHSLICVSLQRRKTNAAT